MATYELLWRAKWTADGATDVDGMIRLMEGETTRLRAMRDAGVKLAAPVEDDYATLLVDDPNVADRFGFAPADDEGEGGAGW